MNIDWYVRWSLGVYAHELSRNSAVLTVLVCFNVLPSTLYSMQSSSDAKISEAELKEAHTSTALRKSFKGSKGHKR
jgi:hypothetical protein